MTANAALSGDSAVIADLCAKLAKAEERIERQSLLLNNAVIATIKAEAERDALHGALARAASWISHAPHSDNCYVSKHYEGDPGNQCNCGKESVSEIIGAALDAARRESLDAAIARERRIAQDEP